MTENPEGDYYLIFKQGGAAEQTVTLPKDGRYEITLWCCPRSSYDGFARVSLGDYAVGTVQARTYEGKWNRCRLVTRALKAGDYVFRLDNATELDVALGIDDVRMVWLEPGDDAPVADGNFEDVDWIAVLPSDAAMSNLRDAIQSSKVLSGQALSERWTVSGTVQLARQLGCMTSMDWRAPRNDSGSFCAVLQPGGVISQTVTVAEAGLYRLSAKACRFATGQSGYGITSATGSAGAVVLAVGDVQEQMAVSGVTLADRFEMARAVYLAAGTNVEISLSAPALSGGVNAVAVDDVRLERAENLVGNPGFRRYSDLYSGYAMYYRAAGWNIEEKEGDSARPRVFLDDAFNREHYFTDAVDGETRYRLSFGCRLSQTLTVHEAGLYRLSYWTVSRVQYGLFQYGPAPILVTLEQGSVTNFSKEVTVSNTSRRFLRQEHLVNLPAPGEYTLAFKTLTTKEDLSTFIDAVCLAKAEAPAPEVAAAAEVRIAAGATLALDYAGTQKVDRVRFAGQSATGVISAADYSAYLEGPGAFAATPRGAVIIIR